MRAKNPLREATFMTKKPRKKNEEPEPESGDEPESDADQGDGE